MLHNVLLALLMKFSKFLQSGSGTSTSFLTPSFFVSFTHRQNVYVLVFLVADALFRLLYHYAGVSLVY